MNATDATPVSRDEIRAAVAAQLGLSAADISDDADLIQLGLDSIRTMKLAGGWRKRGLDINFAQLAANPNIADWYGLLGGSDEAGGAQADSAGANGGSAGAGQSAGMPAARDYETTAGSKPAVPGTGDADSDAEPAVRAPSGADLAGGYGTASVPQQLAESGPVIDATAGADSDANEPFPLATMQHAYWIGRSDEQELGGVAAHLYVEFDGGRNDPARLEHAVRQLIATHPMLRTRVLPDGTQQAMPEPGRPVFEVIDLRAETPEATEVALEEIRERKTHQRLTIEDAQVIDIALTLIDEDSTRLHLDVDMFAGDAMSYRVLVSDLAQLYHGATLPEPGYSYRRYRTARVIDTEARERDRQWWQDRLGDLPGAPALPTVPVADRTEPHRTVRYNHWLAPEGKERLLAAAHQRGVTPAMALAAVFAETIGGWSADPRFLLNVPLFHREPVHPDIDRVIGDFTSSIMLEVDVTDNVSVTERARALQRTMHESGAHSAYSGLEVLRDLGRHRGEPVLAPVVYTSALNLGELFAGEVTETFGEPVWIISQGPQVLLDAQVTEVRGGLLLNWDVRESAFPAGMVEAMFACYTEAVTRLGAGEAGWETEAAVRLPAEQATVRATVNATDGPVSGRPLHQGFFDHARQTPDAPAVVWGLGADVGRWTYAELADKALAVAGALRAAGIGRGDAVAVQLPKGRDQVLAVLGVLAAGGTYVPIGYDQPAGRRAEILRTADIRVALTTAETAMPAEITALVIEETATHTPLSAPEYFDTEDIAYVIFTSGSTGVPKGVDVPHRGAMNTIDAVNEWFDVGPGDRVLALSALEFDASVYDIFGMFAVGGSLVAVNPQERGESTTWVELLKHHRVTILNCVPAMLDMILETGGDQLGDSLRAVTLGGDWVGADLARRLHRQVPGARFSGLGGATETSIHNTICEVDGEPPAHWATVPFGVPLRNVRCRVVSPAGRDCPDWVPGEFWVGGANVAAGYRKDPEKTAQKFVEYDGLRWYKTGDMARYWPDGTIEFLGRADHQVQIRGYRVELGEVESALRAVPGIRHAVAAVVGSGAPKLVAAVAGDPTTDITGVIADLLPSYMIPSRIEILDQMPLTANGKLDRRAVVALLEPGAGQEESVAPRNNVEAALADIVAGVLGVEGIGVHDDFFARGGDSVLATTLIARVREYLDMDHALVADVFAARTVAALATRLCAREAERGTPDRPTALAELYLEIAAMSDDEVLAQS